MRITPHAFERLVEDAFESLPAWVKGAMENIVIVIEDRNPEEPDLLGLYEGSSLTERGEYGLAGGGLLALPDMVTIYRDAILEVCSDADEVLDEVRTTVVHEIAHHFGIDDEQLDELGWA